MKSAKRQREKGASDTEEPERASAKKSKTQVSFLAVHMCINGMHRLGVMMLILLSPLSLGAESARLALRMRGGRGRRGREL